MKSPISEMLGIEFPLLAFSHCRDVVVAVSKAGGFGVLGVTMMSPEQLEEELTWIDQHVDGMPYGVDVLVPSRLDTKDHGLNADTALAGMPPEHRDYVDGILKAHGIEPVELTGEVLENRLMRAENLREDGAHAHLDVAFSHPIKLIANALGVPPQSMIDRAHREGVPIAALCGTAQHAVRQAQAGIDIVVAVGTEAGGHTGEISTMVLIPEVVAALEEFGTPVLAAGGIATGRQMAAAMAMGAAGAWTGSVWLTTAEAETLPVVKEKMLQATSRDTVRSKSRTGKPTRQLRSTWTDAWENPAAPKPLEMPYQGFISGPALDKVDKLAMSGHEGARALATYYVGQAVGLMNQEQSASAVVQDFKHDYLAACERLEATLAG